MKFSKPVAHLFALILLSGTAPGQTDDFNDGDDAGWARQDSIGIIINSPFASFGFPDGGYRISAGSSPNPSQMGPSRAASFRQDVTYHGRLFLSVDLKISNPSIQQSAGFLAFVQPNPLPGAVSGYSLSYQPATGDIVLNRIAGEIPTQLGFAGIQDFITTSVRLILIAENGLFTAVLYNLDDLVNPLATLTASDSTHTSGTAGIFAYADTDDATGPVDVVFDNYRANAITLPELQLTLTGATGYQLTWPDWAVHFAPASSTTLAAESWIPIPLGGLESGGGLLFHNGDRALVPKQFFRLQRRAF